ncbi:MAG TPA: hypothetical protein VMX75_02875 [Spirochaetia bacterium]|nr:hypothetical protein [Spirochaetia bacterium]
MNNLLFSKTGFKKGTLLVLSGFLFVSFVSIPLYGFDWSLNGSYKTFLTGIYNPNYQERIYGIANNTLRLNGDIYPSGWLSLSMSYILYPEIRDPALDQGENSLFSRGAEYRIGDPERRILPRRDNEMENIGLYHEIDRAMATLNLPFADLYVGRQAVSWGSAHVINPTDILVPYRFLDLDTEYRKGVDAVRVRIPFQMNEIDVGFVAGEGFRFERSALFGRTRLYFLETDFSILGMLFKENLLLGLDLARAIGGAGAWAEAAYVIPGVVNNRDDPFEKDYLSISLGMDYNFSGNFYGYVEYYFNSAGKNDPHEYIEILANPSANPAYSEGNQYLLGKHYLFFGGRYTVTPLIPVSSLIMVNMSDLSVDLSLSVEYNIMENVYITAGFYLGMGEGPELTSGVLTRYGSEFGAYPDILYTAVKIYF